jgi:voltage-gated potassium channel
MSKLKTIAGSPAYQVAMLILCIFALGALAGQVAVSLDPEIRTILDYADYAICALFLGDFVVSLWSSPNRWRYMTSWGWLDLLSSIPALNAVRWGRLARIVRLFRVLRALRATKVLTSVVIQRRADNTFLAASLVALFLVVFCSIAVLQVEDVEGGNIKTADDAIWWAMTTITTVGYGDRYPVTGEGRFVAVVLMCAGVGLFGTFSGFLAAWFLSPEEKKTENEIAELRNEIRALRSELRSTAVQAGGTSGSQKR